MKIFKRIFAMVITTVLLLSVVMVSASAATGNQSVSYKKDAYSGTCRLTLTAHGATAYMTAAQDQIGVAVPDAPFYLDGSVTFNEGKKHELYSRGTIPGDGSSNAIDATVSASDLTTVKATCEYFVNGGPVPVGYISLP